MGVGQRWPQAAGTADRNGGIRTMRIGVGGGGESGLAVFRMGGLFYLCVMNNYIIEGYFISQNRNPRKSQETPDKISKLSTGFSRSQNS